MSGINIYIIMFRYGLQIRHTLYKSENSIIVKPAIKSTPCDCFLLSEMRRANIGRAVSPRIRILIRNLIAAVTQDGKLLTRHRRYELRYFDRRSFFQIQSLDMSSAGAFNDNSCFVELSTFIS